MQTFRSSLLGFMVLAVLMLTGCGHGVTPPGIKVYPAVTTTNPVDGAPIVDVATIITVSFDRPMDPATLTSDTFVVFNEDNNTVVGGTVSYSEPAAIFIPNAALAAETHFRVTITTGVRDADGNRLSRDYVWRFTSGAQDVNSPSVTANHPTDGAICVPVDTSITATFSELMAAGSIASSFLFQDSTGQVAGTVDFTTSTNTASFSPAASLAEQTSYTAVITSDAHDLAGNNLTNDFVWNFTTRTEPSDTTVSCQNDIQPIFSSNCTTNCHEAGGMASFMPLTSGQSYDNLVQQPAGYSAGIRVIPCDADNSILYLRISGSSVGNQMPRGGAPLGAGDRNRIRTWIVEGAYDN